MLNTSQLYKDLFSQGAIEEYKIVVDGVEYLDDAIYDNVILKQQLFSTDTFSVGGFALSTLEVKLRVSTLDIPRNANIKFYYRLTNLEENSEWIKKFTGRVTKRKRYTNDVTTIEVVSDASNFDIFLNIFNNQIASYPANNRQVSNLCATHLGLEIDNINDVYDGNNVEYPNEMTVVEVLQNIAALSGGNWIITEDDKLRLVVLNKQIGQIPKYSAFNISSEESLPPISRVTMYYQDDKAFTSGDDTGSELTIDCQWSTQETTNYVLSLYEGYVYQPIQGSGVAIDGAVQLGDHFEYDNGQIQLASKIDYSFTKALTANVDAPLSNEDNYDDPYAKITTAPFKKKVSLGDSYQGVTISRDKGIEMIYSSDGTEENASGKFYADLEKGIAFQYKDIETGIWEDWLYFDKNENIFKLMLKGGDLDTQMVNIVIELNQIMQEIENIHNGNIIPNANGSEDYVGWTGTGILLGVSDLIAYPDLTSTMTALPKIIAGSLSEFGWEFFTSGQMISTYGYISDTQYSFKAKIGNFKPCIITVYEYKADKSANGTIVKQFNNPQSYIQFTEDLKSDTVYARLGIEFPTATPSSRPNISEIMYNKGEPKEWFETPLDAIMFAESSRRQLSNRITDTVTEIDKVSGDIHNTTVDITAKDGVVIKNNNGKGLTILNDNDEEVISLTNDGSVKSYKMIADEMFATNAFIEGRIEANSGNIGGFNITDDVLQGIDIELTGTNIKIGDSNIYQKIMGAARLLRLDANYIDIGSDTSTSGLTQLYLDGNNFAMRLNGNNYISVMGISNTKSGGNIGDAVYRFGNIYLQNAPDISSDSRYKRNILPIDNKLIEIFGKEVEPRTYTMRDSNEIHFGYIAQDVERALYKYTLSKYGLNEAKNVVSKFAVLSKSESYMSLLYGEIAVIMDAYNRRRMDKLEKRIQALEREIK